MKKIFIFGFVAIFERASTILLLPLYSKEYSVEDFGQIDIIQSILTIATLFSFLQIETSLQRFFYDIKEIDKSRYISTTFIFVLLMSTIVISLCCAFIDTIQVMFSIKNGSTLIIALMQLPFISISILSQIILRFENEYNRYFLIGLSASIINFVLIFFCLKFFKGDIKGLFIAQLVSSILFAVSLILSIKKNFVNQFSFSFLKKELKYAIPQVPARIGNVINFYIGRFFIVAYLDAYALGIYSMSFKIASIMQLVYQVFLLLWNQIMFRIMAMEDNKTQFAEVLNIVAPVIFFIVGIITLFSQEILRLMSTNFAESYRYIGIIVFAFAINICKEVVDIGPKLKEKTFFLSINLIISIVINTICLFLFIERFKTLGVVLSMLSGNLALFIISWVNSNRLYYIPFEIDKLLISVLPCFIIIIAMFLGVNFSVISKVFILCLYFAIYSFLLRKYITSSLLIWISKSFTGVIK